MIEQRSRTTAPRPGPGTPASPPTQRFPRRWAIAAAMIAAALMDMIDLTVVNVALPSIRGDLAASATQIEWVVSGYMLAFAATLLTAGSLGDVWGRRRVFLAGIAVFGLSSLAAGLAQSADELIAARVVQGAAAAAMIPQLLATFRVIFDRTERGKAFGLYGMVLGFASAVGLLAGGVLTNADLFGWGWRTIFFVNVPVSVAALVACARLVPETREPGARRPDVIGGVGLTVALVAIVLPLLEGRAHGWPAWTWPTIAAGVAGLVALARRETRRRDAAVAPMLRPRLLLVRAYGAGLGVQLAFSAGLQGFFLIFAVWLQTGRGFSPLGAGLTALAFSVGSFVLAPGSVSLAERHGRRVLVCGAALLTVGSAGIAAGASHVGHGSHPWAVLPGLAVAGAGLSLLVIPLVNVVLAAAPRDAAGSASGHFTTVQQLGGAIGVALVGSLFFGRVPAHGFTSAFTHAIPLVAALFVVAGVLALALPDRAVGEEEVF